MSAIEVLRDWLLQQGATPREADRMLGRRDRSGAPTERDLVLGLSELPATVPHLLALQDEGKAPAALVEQALLEFDGRSWTEKRVQDLIAELEQAADALEQEEGESLSWLYSESLPEGPWVETLSQWEALREHPGTSPEEPDTVLRHRTTGILVQLVDEGRRGWVGRWLSLPVLLEEWPVPDRATLVDAVTEGGEPELARQIAEYDTIEDVDPGHWSLTEQTRLQHAIRRGLDRDQWTRLPPALRRLVTGR